MNSLKRLERDIMNYDEIIESAESLANAYLAKENYIIARYEYAIAANEGGG